MVRITENSTAHVVRDSLNRSRTRMADLQTQNATLKRINKPSDDPTGNIKLMTIRNETIENSQFENNANLAKTFLNYTDSSLEEMTNLIVRAKDLALSQSNTAANSQESRLMVAEEIRNILDQMQSVANRRLGDRYIFSGYKTNTAPFLDGGAYQGDEGKIMVEVQKDVYVGMNLPGKDIFLGIQPPPQPTGPINPEAQATDQKEQYKPDSANIKPTTKGGAPDGKKEIAGDFGFKASEDVFKTLEGLRVGLMTNDIDMIRATLEPLDRIRDRVVTARAQVGSRVQGIDTALANMARNSIFNAELGSSIEDSDLIQVVSDMAKEETVLRASLEASNKLITPSLLDFLK